MLCQEDDLPDVRGYFVAAQLVGGACAIFALRVLYPHVTREHAAEVVLPQRLGQPTLG